MCPTTPPPSPSPGDGPAGPLELSGRASAPALTTPPPGGVYALLADGSTAEIRPASPGDLDAVRELHQRMSPDNIYLRFFSMSRVAGEREARRVCRAPGPGHLALLAVVDGSLAGVASYEATGQPRTAEVAFVADDARHGRGIGTLLLEHLVSGARHRGVRTFTASVLAENSQMLRMFASAGLHARRAPPRDGVIELTFDLPADDADPAWEPYLGAVDLRESHADVMSLRHLLHPESVAVVGVSRRPGTVGRAILHNIITGGYQGRVYAVNPHASQLGGVRSFPSVTALPEAVDLAVIAVPPAAVAPAAADCGRCGVRSLVVITAGLDAGQGADLLAACRRHGMRLVGPNCFGIAVPGAGLDATFAARHPAAGAAGLVMQSGGLGFALAGHLSRLGIGISSFVSVGNKFDVSSNDLLMWWEQDGVTRLAVLYTESFGNPRKFARTARRVGQHIPVLTVHAGRSEAGLQAAASHTAAVATPLVNRQALFRQAGVIATASLAELLDAAALLATQPVPAGRRVAIVSNAGGAGVLAADACADAGLTVHAVTPRTRRRLARLVPASGAVGGPVDTTAPIGEASFRTVLELVAADEGVDAMIAAILPTAATGDLASAVCRAKIEVPLAAVVLDQPEAVRLLSRGPDTLGAVPAYSDLASAARALGHAAGYGAWRARRQDTVPRLAGLRVSDARNLVQRFLGTVPGGGWLAAGQAADLLAAYGIPVAGAAGGADPGGPVTGGTAPDGTVTGGTELAAGITDDPVFGPLVVCGPGGSASGLPAGRVARLAPLTAADAGEMADSVCGAAVPSGHRDGPPVDTDALAGLLLRISRLASDLPGVAELDLNPVIAHQGGVLAVAARVRVAPAQHPDPFLRRLP